MVALLFAGVTNSNAQEMVTGGDMESGDAWTVVDLGAGSGHTETFGYTDMTPSNGEGGCLSMAGEGGWGNAAVCQEITLQRGVDYKLSMEVRAGIDLAETWAEVVIMDRIPTEDGDITTFPISMALNAWDCGDALSVDGPFAENSCAAKLINHEPNNTTTGEPIEMINIAGEGDTTVVLVLKVGAGQPWNVLFDNVSITELSNYSSLKDVTKDVNIFPSKLADKLNISTDVEMKEVQIVSMLGQVVRNFDNVQAQKATFDVADLSEGAYIVIVKDVNGYVGTSKVIKL